MECWKNDDTGVIKVVSWQPADVIRLAALIGAFLLAVGSLMMWFGISADGAIDIKSTVVSGSIKTASAGLFILFLPFASLFMCLRHWELRIVRNLQTSILLPGVSE